MGPLRARLRDATQQAHAALDDVFTAAGLDTRDGYAGFLTAQARIVPPLEIAFEDRGIAMLLPDWPARRRRGALARDLEALGLATPPALAVALPPGAAALLGAAYVLEGARLGATIVLRSVTRAEDPALGAATAFLRHGDRLLWPVFCDILEANEAARAAPAQLVAGAEAAFAAFAAAARERLPHGVH